MNPVKIDELIHRFDIAIPSWGEIIVRPTKSSIDRINLHFGIMLPQDLIYFAKNSKKFGGWFASFGNNYTDRQHVIRINSYWRHRRRTRVIPKNLVAITIGFDEDLYCIDKDFRNPETGEYKIQYWSPGINDGDRYNSFYDYVKNLVSYWEGSQTGHQMH